MKSRTKARGVALQVLFEVDIANHPVIPVMTERLEDWLKDWLEESPEPTLYDACVKFEIVSKICTGSLSEEDFKDWLNRQIAEMTTEISRDENLQLLEFFHLANFSRQITLGVLPMTTELDNFIAQHAPEWPLDQIAVIDRNILRIALWEFAVAECTPVKVAINEAIELAKIYGSDSTPRFVNGVLGSLAARTQEIHQTFGKIKHSESEA